MSQMSQRTRRITASAAESLLSGAPVDSPHPRLAATLRAAAGPTRPGELDGRQAAVAAFHRALQQPPASARRPSRIRTATVRVTFRAAAVAAVLLGTGGVALAATSGAIPNPLNNHHPSPSASAASHGGGLPESSQRPGDPNPSPSLVGLCHAYTAGAGSEHGKALESPAFQALVTAAGGKDAVDAFCTRLLADVAASQGPDGKSAANPGGRPSDHPSHPDNPNKPTAHPSH
jgi:hypothetical protein